MEIYVCTTWHSVTSLLGGQVFSTFWEQKIIEENKTVFEISKK